MYRYALIRHRAPDTVETVARYLPANYEVLYSRDILYPRGGGTETVIAGKDVAGWTLDDYVLPRLASGLISGEEIDLSHPIMKKVPAARRRQFERGWDADDATAGTPEHNLRVLPITSPEPTMDTVEVVVGLTMPQVASLLGALEPIEATLDGDATAARRTLETGLRQSRLSKEWTPRPPKEWSR